MKKKHYYMKTVVSAFLLFIASFVYGETIIYQESFSGEAASALNQRSPEAGASAWVAGDAFRADGSVAAEQNTTATLGFTPEKGKLYQLDVRFDCTSNNTKWIGAGFAKGQSTRSGDRSNQFLQSKGSGTIGKAWALLKGDPAASFPNGNAVHVLATSDPAPFGGGLERADGEIDLRIILNTKGRVWTAIWYAKETGSNAYTVIRPLTELTDHAIDSVGLVTNGAEGRYRYFCLKTVVQAPSASDADGMQVLVREPFEGSAAVPLQHRAPALGNTKWVAGTPFNSDGSVNEGTLATATLAFLPVPGNIYELDVRFDCISTGTKWVGAGFSKGQSAKNDNMMNRFSRSDKALTTGQAWAILKGDPDQTTPNGNTVHMNGTQNGAAFIGDLEVEAGMMDVRIVLNTKRKKWTAAWYAKKASASDYRAVRPTTELPGNDIDSVGLISNRGAGKFDHLILRSTPHSDDDLNNTPIEQPNPVKKPTSKPAPIREPETLGLITA